MGWKPSNIPSGADGAWWVRRRTLGMLGREMGWWAESCGGKQPPAGPGMACGSGGRGDPGFGDHRHVPRWGPGPGRQQPDLCNN